MPSRRHALRLIAGAALAVPSLSPALAEGDLSQAAVFVKQAGIELATVIGDASTPAEKRRRLQPFIDRVVDVDGVARFCLGRYWRQATPAQQQEYTAIFHRVLLNNVVARVGDYRQAKVGVVVGKPVLRDNGIQVPTVVEREGSPPANVVWVVEDKGGAMRIIDVIAEGTSLRVTVQNDYNAFLAHHDGDIAALISALRTQAEG